MSKKNKGPESYLRFFHIACFTPSIDVYIDGKKCYNDVLYEDFTHYKLHPYGEHEVSITLNNTNDPIYERTISLSPYKIYTLILLTDPKHNERIGLYLIEDVSRSIPSNHCMCRIGHFNYSTSLLDFRFTDSDKNDTYKKASCYEMTPYFPLVPSIYHLNILVNLTQKPFLALNHLELKRERFYTFYIIGNNNSLINNNNNAIATKSSVNNKRSVTVQKNDIEAHKKKETPPQIILSIDGNSYLHFIKPED